MLNLPTLFAKHAYLKLSGHQPSFQKFCARIDTFWKTGSWKNIAENAENPGPFTIARADSPQKQLIALEVYLCDPNDSLRLTEEKIDAILTNKSLSYLFLTVSPQQHTHYLNSQQFAFLPLEAPGLFDEVIQTAAIALNDHIEPELPLFQQTVDQKTDIYHQLERRVFTLRLMSTLITMVRPAVVSPLENDNLKLFTLSALDQFPLTFYTASNPRQTGLYDSFPARVQQIRQTTVQLFRTTLCNMREFCAAALMKNGKSPAVTKMLISAIRASAETQLFPEQLSVMHTILRPMGSPSSYKSKSQSETSYNPRPQAQPQQLQVLQDIAEMVTVMQDTPKQTELHSLLALYADQQTSAKDEQELALASQRATVCCGIVCSAQYKTLTALLDAYMAIELIRQYCLVFQLLIARKAEPPPLHDELQVAKPGDFAAITQVFAPPDATLAITKEMEPMIAPYIQCVVTTSSQSIDVVAVMNSAKELCQITEESSAPVRLVGLVQFALQKIQRLELTIKEIDGQANLDILEKVNYSFTPKSPTPSSDAAVEQITELNLLKYFCMQQFQKIIDQRQPVLLFFERLVELTGPMKRCYAFMLNAMQRIVCSVARTAEYQVQMEPFVAMLEAYSIRNFKSIVKTWDESQRPSLARMQQSASQKLHRLIMGSREPPLPELLQLFTDSLSGAQDQGLIADVWQRAVCVENREVRSALESFLTDKTVTTKQPLHVIEQILFQKAAGTEAPSFSFQLVGRSLLGQGGTEVHLGVKLLQIGQEAVERDLEYVFKGYGYERVVQRVFPDGEEPWEKSYRAVLTGLCIIDHVGESRIVQNMTQHLSSLSNKQLQLLLSSYPNRKVLRLLFQPQYSQQNPQLDQMYRISFNDRLDGCKLQLVNPAQKLFCGLLNRITLKTAGDVVPKAVRIFALQSEVGEQCWIKIGDALLDLSCSTAKLVRELPENHEITMDIFAAKPTQIQLRANAVDDQHEQAEAAIWVLTMEPLLQIQQKVVANKNSQYFIETLVEPAAPLIVELKQLGRKFRLANEQKQVRTFGAFNMFQEIVFAHADDPDQAILQVENGRAITYIKGNPNCEMNIKLAQYEDFQGVFYLGCEQKLIDSIFGLIVHYPEHIRLHQEAQFCVELLFKNYLTSVQPHTIQILPREHALVDGQLTARISGRQRFYFKVIALKAGELMLADLRFDGTQTVLRGFVE